VDFPAPLGPATIQNQGMVSLPQALFFHGARVFQTCGDQSAHSSIGAIRPSGRCSTGLPCSRPGTASPEM
jgi:hypothetical protein